MAQAAGKRLAWFVRAVGFFSFFVGVSFRFVTFRSGCDGQERDRSRLCWKWVVGSFYLLCCGVLCCGGSYCTCVRLLDVLFAGLCLVLWVVNEEGECWPPRAFKNYY